MARTLKELAEEAYMVQDACNLLAVVNGMARAVKELREILPSWDDVDNHPVTRLWADKIASLTGTQLGGSLAPEYLEIHRLRNGEAT